MTQNLLPASRTSFKTIDIVILRSFAKASHEDEANPLQRPSGENYDYHFRIPDEDRGPQFTAARQGTPGFRPWALTAECGLPIFVVI